MKVVAGGTTYDLGSTEDKPTVSIVDYSRRDTDDFGVTTVVPRGFARRLSVRMALPFASVDAVQRQLVDLRAMAAQWIADDRYSWLSAQGYYKDFQLDLPGPTVSFCTLTIEGLAETETVADTGIDPAPGGQASTLRLIQPVEVTDTVLVSSSVAENDATAWASGNSYAVGAHVVRAHRVWESVIAGNAGNDPTTTIGKWLDTGPTNRFAMFDQALGTTTTATDSINVTLAAGALASGVALLDVVGQAGRVRVIKGAATLYDQTTAIGGRSSVTFLGLPEVSDAQIVVNLVGASSGGAPVAVGTLIVGRLVGLGLTETSPTAGITDYSRKEVDEFGEVTIVQRAFAKRMTAKALIRTDAIDIVANRIASVRAIPSLWIGDTGLDTLTVYGFFKDFSIEVGENVSKLSLTIEGLSKAPAIPTPIPEGASVVIQGSVDGSTWHIGLQTGDVFMRVSVDGGATFGSAVRIVGEGGDPGEDGSYQQLIFQRSATRPATPTGGGIPAGWSDGVPAGANLIWMSVQYQRNGIALGPWSTPEQIKGDPGATLAIAASPQNVKYDATDVIASGDVTLTTSRQRIDAVPYFILFGLDGTALAAGTAASLAGDNFTSSDPDNLVLKQAWLNSAIVGYGGGVRIVVSAGGVSDTVTLIKVKDGADGPSIQLNPPASQIRVGSDGNYVGGQDIRFVVSRANLPGTPFFQLISSAGAVLFQGAASDFVAVSPTNWSSSGVDELVLKAGGVAENMGALGGSVGRFSINVYVPGYPPTAQATIQKVLDGQKGSDSTVPGPPGRDAIVFQQDATPSNPVLGDTWVTATAPYIWRKWNGSAWVKILGNVSALDIIDEAYIANLSVGTAKIKDLSVGTIKIADGATSTMVAAEDKTTRRVAYTYYAGSPTTYLGISVSIGTPIAGRVRLEFGIASNSTVVNVGGASPGAGNGQPPLQMVICRVQNGQTTVIVSQLALQFGGSFPIIDNPTAGYPVTYEMRFYHQDNTGMQSGGAGTDVTAQILFVTEFKK